jgi:predicted SAM-dependent methyltransferase
MKWEEIGALSEAVPCQRLEPVDADPPYDRQRMERLGLAGLQFGSFHRRHPACLNADLRPLADRSGRRSQRDRIVRVDQQSHFIELDATRPLPFADGAFEWVYAEHFIEHITRQEAAAWLREVRRILRAGGFARITTPDLRRYVAGYLEEDEAFFASHRQRMHGLWGLPPMETRRAWMVNQIFYFWGHKWIYDAAELRHAAGEAGFPAESFRECAFGQGRDPLVSSLDFELRSDETVYVELSIPGL